MLPWSLQNSYKLTGGLPKEPSENELDQPQQKGKLDCRMVHVPLGMGLPCDRRHKQTAPPSLPASGTTAEALHGLAPALPSPSWNEGSVSPRPGRQERLPSGPERRPARRAAFDRSGGRAAPTPRGVCGGPRPNTSGSVTCPRRSRLP